MNVLWETHYEGGRMKGTISYEWKPVAEFNQNDLPDYLCVVAVAMDGTEPWFFESHESFMEAIDDLYLEQYAVIPWPKLPADAHP